MHGDQTLGRCHLRPVADPADMAGIAQGHRRQSHRPAFVDADAHRLGRYGLAEAVSAVDHGEHRGIGHDLHGSIGEDGAVAFHLNIARHPDDAVAVMAGQVGADQIGRHSPALLDRTAGGDEDIADKILQ
jgi:hypothetical protein